MRWALAILVILTAACGSAQVPPASKPPENCFKLRRQGKTAEMTQCFLALTAKPDSYARAEGWWGLRKYTEANDAFKQAIKDKPKDPNVRVRWGRLLLERFNSKEATDLFNEALEIQKDYAPALVGLSVSLAGNFEKRAVVFAEKALEADAKQTEAHEVLAQLALEDSDPKRAREQAEMALKDDAESLDAMAVQAAADVLEEKESPWLAKIEAVNPRYGEAWNTVARFLVINRRYEDGIAMYRQAIERDPEHWEAWSQLGIQLMRLGREDEARKCLETAYKNGHKNNPTVNSLTLIDSYKNFITYKHERYTLRLHKKEAELLRPYMEEQLERILETYDRKYGFRLKEHVQLEVYPEHEDFAVRTVGMPGLGALGVTFGSVIAMDSPSGRKAGTFHWASTLWHEMSHVYSLIATKHRISRWFTEGLAVYEETATHPDWGDRVDPEILKAVQEKKLLPVAELERGFVRPSFPNQVIVSYFQAGRICNYIEKKWGHAKLIEMMNAYQKPVTSEQLIERHLGMKAADFDREFFAWIDGQFREMGENLEPWRKKLSELNKKARAKEWDAVLADGPKLRDMYPDYVEKGSAYELIADAHEGKGDKKAAAEELMRYANAGGRDPGLLLAAAEKLEGLGRKSEAADLLNRINLVYPVEDEKLHQRLGALYLELNNAPGAVREYRSAVHSKPVDKAAAHYNLAKALVAARRTDEAQDEIVNALEAAPGFKPAQKLLLELSAQQPKK
jgi:cellulose synthase operon protein C